MRPAGGRPLARSRVDLVTHSERLRLGAALLCYRCGSHVPDGSAACGACGQELSSGHLRAATGSFSRRRPPEAAVEGAPFQAGDRMGDRYRVQGALGAGPVGFVFRARDRELEADVVLKVLAPGILETPDERRAFSQGLRPARKLAHASLARVFDEGEEGGRAFFTRPFLDGLTMRRILALRRERSQAFAPQEIEAIFAQLAAALESSRRLGPHGCLKPENILVLPDLVKVTDYGLALALPRSRYAAAQSAGTSRRYLAPEYAKGAAIDGRADVYSLGVLLAEMEGGTFPDLGLPGVSAGSSAPRLSSRLESLVRKATQDDPVHRHASAAEFLEELREALSS